MHYELQNNNPSTASGPPPFTQGRQISPSLPCVRGGAEERGGGVVTIPHSKPHTPHSAQQIQLKYREIIIENAQVFLVDKFSPMGYNLRVAL